MDDAIAADFLQMGLVVDPDTVVRQDDDAFEVWKENWDSLNAFLAAETQWRVAATMAGLIWIGIDYTALDVILRRRNLPDHVFDDVMDMERTALSVFAEADR